MHRHGLDAGGVTLLNDQTLLRADIPEAPGHVMAGTYDVPAKRMEVDFADCVLVPFQGQ